jgi:hypothetical protein
MAKSYAATAAYATFLSLLQIILVVDLLEWRCHHVLLSMRGEMGVLFDP